MEERLGYELKRAQQAFRGALDGALGELGLSAAQYAALAALEDDPGLSSAELARRSFVTAQTMHGLVGGLERAGLVERRAHPAHGRILETTLTEEGLRRLGEAHRRVRAIEARMARGLSKQERAQLFGLLRRCALALEARTAA